MKLYPPRLALGVLVFSLMGCPAPPAPPPDVVFSAAATVPNRSQAFVVTTPADKTFILTQVCSTRPDGLRLNAGAAIGDIPVEREQNCTEFVPGIAIPPQSNINCFDQVGAGGNLRCLVTGVLRN